MELLSATEAAVIEQVGLTLGMDAAAIEREKQATIERRQLLAELEAAPVGRDGERHAVNIEDSAAGTFGWYCLCGDGGAFIPTEATAQLRASEHLAEVEPHTEEV